MMALVGCAVVLMIALVAVVVLRALSQGRNVKAGLKIPFATFFFEASNHDKVSRKLLSSAPSKVRKGSD